MNNNNENLNNKAISVIRYLVTKGCLNDLNLPFEQLGVGKIIKQEGASLRNTYEINSSDPIMM